MIQRIQSVYLLSSCALMALLFLNPLAAYMTAQSPIDFDLFGFRENGTFVLYTTPLVILVSVIGLLALTSIFLYKNRVLQIRLCIFNIILMLGFYALGAYYIFSQINFEVPHASSYKLGCLFPFIALVFTYLAMRAIGKDEALIRSADRIR